MTTQRSRFMVITVLYEGLEDFLNNLEDIQPGGYEIVSIIGLPSISLKRAIVGVTIKFHLLSDEPEFNETEIRRRLGFGDSE